MSDQAIHASAMSVLWPWDDAPLEQELLSALGDAEEAEDDDEIAVPDDAVHGMTVRVPDHPVQLLIWIARRDEADRQRIDWFRDWPAEAAEAARKCKWEIGVETLLNPADPLESYHLQLRCCDRLSPEAPALYDASSFRLFPGIRLRRMAQSNIPPETETLFSVHAVRHDEESRDGPCWLHTHGLWRAELPEIEMIGVPPKLVTMGASLINDLVDLLIGSDVPNEEDDYEVGVHSRIAWRPWETVMQSLPPTACGGANDRADEDDDGAHTGRRIVIGAFERDANGHRHWSAPSGLLQRMSDDDAVCFKTVRETQRRASRARETWPEFAMLFVKHRESDWKFTAKFAYPVQTVPPPDPDDIGAREHLWVLVHEIAGRRVRGVLLNQPIHVSGLKEGDMGWHEVSLLTDWFIRTSDGRIEPSQVEGTD